MIFAGPRRTSTRSASRLDAVEDHAVAQSIYLHDPDGNAIEVYVDTSDLWRTDPQAVASISPLTL